MPVPPIPVSRHSSRVCATLATSRGRTSSSSTVGPRGRADHLPHLAAELVRLNVEVIVARGNLATRAAKQATSTIPIVISTGDPVGEGFVTTLAHPGGNITGLSNVAADLDGKRLEFLKE